MGSDHYDGMPPRDGSKKYIYIPLSQYISTSFTPSIKPNGAYISGRSGNMEALSSHRAAIVFRRVIFPERQG